MQTVRGAVVARGARTFGSCVRVRVCVRVRARARARARARVRVYMRTRTVTVDGPPSGDEKQNARGTASARNGAAGTQRRCVARTASWSLLHAPLPPPAVAGVKIPTKLTRFRVHASDLCEYSSSRPSCVPSPLAKVFRDHAADSSVRNHERSADFRRDFLR